MNLKKIAPYIIVFLFALLVWDVFTGFGGMHFHLDGEQFDGPFGTLLGLLFAGGGTIIAILVMAFVGALLAVLFAGLGIILFGTLGVVALAGAVAFAPLLLPLLLPIALIWYLASRSRKNRLAREQAV